MTDRDGYRPKLARGRKDTDQASKRQETGREYRRQMTRDRRDRAENGRERQDAEGSGWKENSWGPGRVTGTTADENRGA